MKKFLSFVVIIIIAIIGWFLLVKSVINNTTKPLLLTSKSELEKSQSVISIVSPTTNSVVAGTITVTMKFSKPPSSTDPTSVWWTQLLIDNNSIVSGYNHLSWNTTTVNNGLHTLKVKAFPYNSTTAIGRETIFVKIRNGVSPTATPIIPTGTAKPTPTTIKTFTSTSTATSTVSVPTTTPTSTVPIPTATPVIGHFTMHVPGASLPTEASCITTVNNSPIAENAAWNRTDGDYNNPPASIPSYFYTYAPCCNELPHSDFALVDGNYSGSTDDLIRITACKWGIDEDYVRAQAWIEDGWHQDCAAAHGGSGCRVGGDMNSPSGNPSGLPITSITPNGVFTAINGYGNPGGSTDHWDSWSMLQTKVWYEWMTWPMLQDSTSFGLDFRFAEMRGCVNGDQYSYYNSQSSSQGTDYQNAVNAAKSNPNGSSRISGWSNLQYLSYGCIDTHFSGDWFNGNSDSYLNNFLNSLTNAPWPGGLR